MNLQLFCMNRLSIFKNCFNKPLHKRLYKLYEEGSERLETDLSLEKLIKHLRDIKVLVKNQLMDDDIRF